MTYLSSEMALTTTTCTYDTADQLTSDGMRDYTWDPDGNLTPGS